MAWAVRATYQGTAGQSSSRSITVPATAQVGDLLFAHFYWDAGGDHVVDSSALITAPAGWNEGPRAERLRGINFDFYSIVYWKIATSGDINTTYTWSNNGGQEAAWRESVLVAFYNTSGAISATPIESSNIADSDVVTTAWTAPSSTSATTGALHIIAGSSWTLGAGAPPAGYTEAIDNASSCQVAWKELGTAPVTTGTLFYDASNDVWAATSTIIKAVPAIIEKSFDSFAENNPSTPSPITLSTAPLPNELILIWTVFNNQTNGVHCVPSITGFTKLGESTDASGWNRLTLFGKIASGSEGTTISVAWTGAADALTFGSLLLSGTVSTLPTNIVTTPDSSSNTTVTIPAITTNSAYSLDIVCVGYGGTNGGSFDNYSAWGSSLIERIDARDSSGQFAGLGVAHALRATAGVQSATSVTQTQTDTAPVIRIEVEVLTAEPTSQSASKEIYLSGPNAQKSRPDTDVTDGAWTNQAGNNTNLYDSINEITIDDADYIQSELNPSSSATEIGLNESLPPDAGSRVLRYRYAKDASSGNQINLTTAIVQSTTVVESWTHNDISNTFATVAQTLANPITDYNDLRVRFTASQVAINMPVFVAAGTGAAANGGNVTPALPASLANDQILICAIHSSDNVVSTMPSPWVSFVGLNNTTAQRVHLFWKRITNAAGETAPLVTHASGGVILARIYSFSGCVTTGDPWNAGPTSSTAGSTALVNGPSITTTQNQSLVLFFGFFEDDPSVWSTPTGGWSAVSNVHFSALGNDAAMAAFSLPMATAGATSAAVTNLSTGTFGATSPRVGTVLALSPTAPPGNRRARISWVEFETPSGSAGQPLWMNGSAAPTSQSAGKEIYLSGVSAGTPQSAGTQIHLSGISTQSDNKQLHIAGFAQQTAGIEAYLSGKIAQTAGIQVHVSGKVTQTDGKQLHIAGRETQTAGTQIHLIAPTAQLGANTLHLSGRTAQSAGVQSHIAGFSTDAGTRQLHLAGSIAQTAGKEIYLTAPTGIITGKEIYIVGRTTQIAGNTLHIAGKETQVAGFTIHFISHIAQTGAVPIHLSSKTAQTGAVPIHLAGKETQLAGKEIYLTAPTGLIAGKEIYLTAPTGQIAGKELYLAGRSTQTGANTVHVSGKVTQIAGNQLHVDGLAGSITASKPLHIVGHIAQTGAQTIHFTGIVLFTNGQTLYLTGHAPQINGTPVHVAGRTSTSVGHTLALSGKIVATTGVETVVIGRTSQSFGHELAIAGQVTGIAYSHTIHVAGRSVLTNGQAIHLAGKESSAGTVQIHFVGSIISVNGVTTHVVGRTTSVTGQTVYTSGIAQTAQSGQTIHVSGREATATGQVTHIVGKTTAITGQPTWIVGHVTQLGTRQIHLFGASGVTTGQRLHTSGLAEEDGSATLFLRGEQIGGVRHTHGSHQLYLNSIVKRSHGTRPLFIKSSSASVGRKTVHIEGEI